MSTITELKFLQARFFSVLAHLVVRAVSMNHKICTLAWQTLARKHYHLPILLLYNILVYTDITKPWQHTGSQKAPFCLVQAKITVADGELAFRITHKPEKHTTTTELL